MGDSHALASLPPCDFINPPSWLPKPERSDGDGGRRGTRRRPQPAEQPAPKAAPPLSSARQTAIAAARAAARAAAAKFAPLRGQLVWAEVAGAGADGATELRLELAGASQQASRGLLPASECVPGERLASGDRIAVLVHAVTGCEADGDGDRSSRPERPTVLVSRSDAQLVARLFEASVPAVRDGDVEVENAARAPGRCCKARAARLCGAEAQQPPGAWPKALAGSPDGRSSQQTYRGLCRGTLRALLPALGGNPPFAELAILLQVLVSATEQGRQRGLSLPEEIYAAVLGHQGSNLEEARENPRDCCPAYPTDYVTTSGWFGVTKPAGGGGHHQEPGVTPGVALLA